MHGNCHEILSTGDPRVTDRSCIKVLRTSPRVSVSWHGDHAGPIRMVMPTFSTSQTSTCDFSSIPADDPPNFTV